MKIHEILNEDSAQQNIMAHLQYLYKNSEGNGEAMYDGHDIVNYVNTLQPPNLQAQQFVWDNLYYGYYLYLRNVQQPLLNKILSDTDLIKDSDDEDYEDFVMSHFKNNKILIQKWLRYAENIRNENN